MSTTPRGIHLRSALKPGDLGTIIHLHGVHYAREYGLDITFEPYVAKPLADFVLAGNGRLWITEEGEQILGSIGLVDADCETGQLWGQIRWFILAPQARGLGLGGRMVAEALAHARERGMTHVFLWTFADLHAAMHLYEGAGFVVTEQRSGEIWGGLRTEVHMDLELET